MILSGFYGQCLTLLELVCIMNVRDKCQTEQNEWGASPFCIPFLILITAKSEKMGEKRKSKA